jgi:hypothetical protein
LQAGATIATSDQHRAIMCSSESVEYYTPARVLDLVVEILGAIDLDPAWHPDALVRAALTYTREQDGLAHKWRGRVFLNPPYGDGIDRWIKKLVDEHAVGNVTEAVALLPNRSDTNWFRRLDQFPRCCVHHRLRFVNGHVANESGSSIFPSVIIYLGQRLHQFARTFETLGPIFVRYIVTESTSGP